MSVSLYAALIPPLGTNERTTIDRMISGDTNKKTKFERLPLQIAKQAAATFQHGEYEKFDALVGDFGCERRALKVLQLAGREDLLKEAREVTQIDTRVPRDLLLSSDFLYLVLCYLTCKTKKQELVNNEEREISCPDKLGVPNEIQGKGVGAFVNYAQCKLSQLSTEFMRAEATTQKEFFAGVYLREMSETYPRSPRMATPLFYNMDVVMESLSASRAIVVVKNKTKIAGIPRAGAVEMRIYFQGEGNGQFRSIERPEAGVKAHFVIEGYVNEGVTSVTLRERVQEVGLKTLMLAVCAQEWQYPALVQNPPSFPEIAHYAEKAKEIGCHNENRSLIFVDHCYVERGL